MKRLSKRGQYAVAVLLTLAITPLAMCEEVLFYQLATGKPYTRLAEQAVQNWNANGCVLLVKAELAPLVVGAWPLGPTDWSGTVLRFPETLVQIVAINASTLVAFGDWHKQSALCHELGHALGIVGHSLDPASCMGIGWTSAAPSQGDLALLSGRCP